ncbi:single-stranded DNA-binding protein [Fusibacter sp. JL216-2]|uniref:single-stranded DNA-binding protein n=1 Tax=Fusibacter sp. JL216-2 TaxID=3071453 RepID=UPI003D353000
MNQVVLIGRLVRDPELRFIAGSGRAVTNFTLAVDKGMSRDKKAELQAQGKPTADFIRIVAWGKTAELCANYLSKGSQVAVNGSINTGQYKTQSGETRYTTDVVANNVEFIGSRNDNRQPEQGSDDFSMGGMDTSDFQAIEDDDDIPF